MPSMWLKNMDRLKKKHETAREYVPTPVLHATKGATIGIISFGSTEAAVLEAMHQLDTEHGIKADFLRVRALPLESALVEFIKKHPRVYVIENNLDGQMHSLIQLHAPEYAMRLVSISKCDGLPLSARWIMEAILEQER